MTDISVEVSVVPELVLELPAADVALVSSTVAVFFDFSVFLGRPSGLFVVLSLDSFGFDLAVFFFGADFVAFTTSGAACSVSSSLESIVALS